MSLYVRWYAWSNRQRARRCTTCLSPGAVTDTSGVAIADCGCVICLSCWCSIRRTRNREFPAPININPGPTSQGSFKARVPGTAGGSTERKVIVRGSEGRLGLGAGFTWSLQRTKFLPRYRSAPRPTPS